MDAGIEEICRRAKITDYLAARGVELTRTRRGAKCCCPLPGHKDDTPSFSIMTVESGAEIFKCFGCGKSGSIISLVSIMEGIKKGAVVHRLSSQHGVRLGAYVVDEKLDPLGLDVVGCFCKEDEQAARVASLALSFLGYCPDEDAVNKVSRIYQKLDFMVEEGDDKGLLSLEAELRKIMRDYNPCQNWSNFTTKCGSAGPAASDPPASRS